MSGRDRVALAAFFANALLAGGNGVAIRFSNRELPPLWGASLRFSLAAALLFAILAALRLALPRGRALLGPLLYGVFQFGGSFGLYYYALVRVHAGLGQTLLALVPLATLLLAVAQGQEKLRTAAVVAPCSASPASASSPATHCASPSRCRRCWQSWAASSASPRPPWSCAATRPSTRWS